MRVTAIPNINLKRPDARHLLWPGALAMALLSVSLGLADLVRELEAWLMFPLALGAMLTGWLLAHGRVSWQKAAPLVLAAGVIVILVRVGRLGSRLLALFPAAAGLAAELWRWPQNGPPSAGPLIAAAGALGESLGALLGRLADWLLGLASGSPAFDPAASALVWGMAVWLVSGWAGWVVRRYRRPLLGIAPAGTLLAAGVYAVGAEITPLLWFLGSALALIALTRYHTQQRRWQTNLPTLGPPPAGLHGDVTLSITLLSLSLVTLAALAPAISIEKITALARRLAAPRTGQSYYVVRSLGLEAQSVPAHPLDLARAPGLPRHHLIGSGPELSQRPVMSVAVDSPPPEPGAAPPRYYWRSLTYDRYTGRGWKTGPTETVAYSAGEQTVDAHPAGLQRIRQTVTISGDGDGLLYAAGTLLAADHNFTVAWRDAGTDAPAADPFGAGIEAATYQVQSLRPRFSEAKLRAAGNAYPGWVKARYLSLPQSVPPQVLALARDLTATAPTPFDRAKAIERYLRTFPYTLDLPAPPPERDIADYFLFDLRKGYCDYYATTMVVLARAAGLPARLAVGYAGGVFDSTANRYLITEANAHSWVEVYFAGFGWVEFEPTAGLPPLERPAGAVPPPSQTEPETGPQPEASPRSLPPWRPASAGGLALLLLAALVWWAADWWHLRGMSPAAAPGAIYRRLRAHAARLGVPLRPGDTPFEFEAAFAGRLSAAHPAARLLSRLVAWYVQARFSPRRPPKAAQTQAVGNYRRLRWQVWRARLRAGLPFGKK